MSDDLAFVVNLRAMTATTSFRTKLHPPGYLVPPAYLTADLRAAAARFSQRGEAVVADNGLFDDIQRLTSQLSRDRKGPQLARRAAELAATVDPRQHLQDQLSVKPTALIGVEDITAALWLRLGLTASTNPNLRATLRRHNRGTARHAAAFAKEIPDGCDYLPVASAQDYDTAFDAGREFAAAGLHGAALGFGAFMNDDSSVSTVKLHGRLQRLPNKMPNRYLATALVARGFWDGWLRERSNAPARFHFLGLGAPIMIGIAACAARKSRSLTFDATSPIKDALQGTIYVSKPAYLKIRTWKAAQRLASSDAEKWLCPCAFCRSFIAVHPFDYQHGRQWYIQRKRRAVPRTALRPGGALFHAYPLFGQPGSSMLGRDIEFARVGHNHWALKQVTDELGRARAEGALISHVASVVADYEQATSRRNYSAAVRLAFDIVRGTWP